MTADSNPSYYYIDPAEPAELAAYLRERGFLDEDEPLASVAKAGEGNMNLTLRLVTDRRSVILKQARPWVEKYPQIAAPPDRALVEAAFYDAVASRPEVAGMMPRLLASVPDQRVLLLEDLGKARDMTTLYAGEPLKDEAIDALARYLRALHAPFGDNELPARLANRDMRALNHTHIFELPLAADNGLDLEAITPGLTEPAASLKRDAAYVERVHRLGEIYLSDGDGDVLCHGDYFPGSWLRTDAGIRVIDPEFCFLGEKAFDLGVMLAHLYLSGQDEAAEERLLEAYREEAQTTRARQFAGVEIMRRLIGVAQLPLERGIEEKTKLLEQSRRLVLTGDLP